MYFENDCLWDHLIPSSLFLTSTSCSVLFSICFLSYCSFLFVLIRYVYQSCTSWCEVDVQSGRRRLTQIMVGGRSYVLLISTWTLVMLFWFVPFVCFFFCKIDMAAAVIDLGSSDEEDDRGTQTRPSFPSSSRPVGSSSSLQVAKVENLDNMERLQSKSKVEKDEEMHWGELSHPEEADQRGVGVASCSTSDPARNSLVVETERRPKMQDGGRGKSAQAGSNPSSEAQDASLCRHFWGAGDYEVQPKLKRNRTPQGRCWYLKLRVVLLW